MNERFHLDLKEPATTQAAEGMPRRAWSVAEVEAIQAAGIIGDDERFELIGGEVVPMQAKGGRHERVKRDLNRHFQRTAPDDIAVIPETTLRLDEKSFLEPDFCVSPQAINPGDMRGYDVLLAIEIADSSLGYDLGRKIGVYAAYGIPEVWVIDANTLVTYVHRKLGVQGYSDIFAAGPADTLTSVRAPSVSMCMEQLGLKPA